MLNGKQLARLKEHELCMQHLEELWENASCGLALVGPQGQFINVNPAYCKLTGYAESELTAKTFQDITHPDDVNGDVEDAKAVIAGVKTSYTMDKRYITKFDSTVKIHLKVIGIYDFNTDDFLHFLVQAVPVAEAGMITSAQVEILMDRIERLENGRHDASLDLMDVWRFIQKNWQLLGGLGGAVWAGMRATHWIVELIENN